MFQGFFFPRKSHISGKIRQFIQISIFFRLTEVAVHDSKAMKEIPYEAGSYYILNRAYNNFKMLYQIHQIETYFVISTKKNLQYKPIEWKRRFPQNVLSDMIIELTGFYPKPLRLVKFWNEEQK